MNTLRRRLTTLILSVALIIAISSPAAASGIIYYTNDDMDITTDECYTQYQVLDFVADSGETYEQVVLLSDDELSNVSVQFDLEDGSQYTVDAYLEEDGSYLLAQETPFAEYIHEIITDALSYGFWFLIK